MLVTACATAPNDAARLEASLLALPATAPAAAARAELVAQGLAGTRRRDRAAGVKPGPGMRYPVRSGRVTIARDARIAVQLYEGWDDLVVPRVVYLHADSGEPYVAGKLFLRYSGEPVEVLLLDVDMGHALGVVVPEPGGRAVRLGDEAWILPYGPDRSVAVTDR
ncbi:MAG: hypothetical protein AB7O97_22010 [Planctomycetota bacterium]